MPKKQKVETIICRSNTQHKFKETNKTVMIHTHTHDLMKIVPLDEINTCGIYKIQYKWILLYEHFLLDFERILAYVLCRRTSIELSGAETAARCLFHEI